MTGETSNDQTDPRTIVQGYRSIEALIPAHWAEDAIIANGIRHHYYRTGGDRPPVMLLHGILDGSLTWLRTARALEQDYDVIMVDTRGHGLSDGIATGYSVDLLAEDAAGMIRALGLDAVRLLGHSQGGTTGIHVATRYPELVRALIVEGWSDTSMAGGDPSASPAYIAWFNSYLAWLEQLKTQSHAERMVSALSQRPPGMPLPPEEEYVTWVENCARLDLDLVRSSMAMWAQVAELGRAMVEALQRTTCPVLIMKSGSFPQPGPKAVREEASDQPNIKIVRFENTGHLIHSEEFELFIAQVREFFV